MSPAELQRDHVVGVVCVLLSAAFFALAGIFIKLTPWSGASINGGRCLVAFFVVLAYIKLRGQKLVVNKTTVLAGAVNLVVMLAFSVANKLTTAANVIVLQFTEPIWVILLIWLVWRQKPTKAAAITCAVVFAGIVCFFSDQLSPDGVAGSLLAILSGFTYAGVFLFKKIPGCDFDSALLLSYLMCFAIGLPSMVQETVWTPEVLVNILILGTVQLGFAFILLGRGLDSVSPMTASLTSTLEPILNPILAAVVLGETLGPLSLLGAVLVIGAATVYNVYTVKKAT